MSLADAVLLLAAGFGSGLIGYLTGLASLVSYPALLAVGLPPVAANVTNTVALVAVGAGATTNSIREITGEGRRIIPLTVAAVAGGLIGAVLLLAGPAETFEAVVPWFVALAALALLLQPWLRTLGGDVDRPRTYIAAMVVVAVYGGYFGAGAGVAFLALTLLCTSETIWRAQLFKSYFLGVANLVAALWFIAVGTVDWWAAAIMAVGMFVGGWCGPPVSRRIPASVLRIAVAAAGFGLAAFLWAN